MRRMTDGRKSCHRCKQFVPLKWKLVQNKSSHLSVGHWKPVLILRPATTYLERCGELKVGFATAHTSAPGHATNTRPSTGIRRHHSKEPMLSGKQRSGYNMGLEHRP